VVGDDAVASPHDDIALVFGFEGDLTQTAILHLHSGKIAQVGAQRGVCGVALGQPAVPSAAGVCARSELATRAITMKKRNPLGQVREGELVSRAAAALTHDRLWVVESEGCERLPDRDVMFCFAARGIQVVDAQQTDPIMIRIEPTAHRRKQRAKVQRT